VSSSSLSLASSMAGPRTGFGACVCVEACLRGTARGANLTPEFLMTDAETGVRVLCDIVATVVMVSDLQVTSYKLDLQFLPLHLQNLQFTGVLPD
jgi:hypothetical protein